MSTLNYIQEVYKKATCLYSQKEVDGALDRMALEITEKLQDKNPIVLGVMIGGIVPLGHLLTRWDFPLEVGYVHATRYQGEIVGSELHWKVRPPVSVADRTILVVDDILDEGITLAAILAEIKAMKAKEVYSAVLVDKKKERPRENHGLLKADFVGLTVEDYYIFGYGLDYHNYLRNAPGIYKVAQEHQ